MSTKRKSQGFQFTRRDSEILNLINELDKPDTSHIAKLLFRPSGNDNTGKPKQNPEKYQTTSSQAIRRLEHLRATKLIQSERPPIIEGMEGLPFAHSLTAGGYDEVALYRGISVAELDKPKRLISTKSMHYPHYKKTLDILTDMILATEFAGISIPLWKKTRVLEAEYANHHADLYIGIAVSDFLMHLFYEIDLATEPVKRWEEKVQAIMNFWLTETFKTLYLKDEYRQQYGRLRLRVPVVTVNERRLVQLIAATERAGGKSRFWFTTFDKITPLTILTEQISVSSGLIPVISGGVKSILPNIPGSPRRSAIPFSTCRQSRP